MSKVWPPLVCISSKMLKCLEQWTKLSILFCFFLPVNRVYFLKMEILLVKVISALTLWILSLCFGLMIPYLIWKSRAGYHCVPSDSEIRLMDDERSQYYDETYRPRQNENSLKNRMKRCFSTLCSYNIISVINCLCGGLFLGICLLELLPESRQSVDKIIAHLGIKFPMTELIVSIGLLLVMFIEQVVTGVCARRKESRGNSNSSEQDHQQPCSLSENSPHLEVPVRRLSTNTSEPSEHLGCVVTDQCDIVEIVSGTDDNLDQTPATEATRALVLIGMLSIHSIFEGLALGLEASVTQLIQLLIAISVHKSVLAFGLGMRLFDTFGQYNLLLAIVCTVVFCTASPFGCTVGVLTTHLNTNSNVTTISTPKLSMLALEEANLSELPGTLIATAILQCFATGTFLYVTFIEVIPSEFAHVDEMNAVVGKENHSEHGAGRHAGRYVQKKPIAPMLKLLVLVLGFAAVAGMQFL